MSTKKYNNHDEDTPLVTCTTSQTWQSYKDWDLNTNKHGDQVRTTPTTMMIK
jgi:hypothetical protein